MRIKERIRAQRKLNEIMWVDNIPHGPLSVKVTELPDEYVEVERLKTVIRFETVPLEPDGLMELFTTQMQDYITHIEEINSALNGKLFRKGLSLRTIALEITQLPNGVFALRSPERYLNLPFKPGSDLDALTYLHFKANGSPASLVLPPQIESKLSSS